MADAVEGISFGVYELVMKLSLKDPDAIAYLENLQNQVDKGKQVLLTEMRDICVVENYDMCNENVGEDMGYYVIDGHDSLITKKKE